MRMIWRLNTTAMYRMMSILVIPGMSMVIMDRITTIIQRITMSMDITMVMNLVNDEDKEGEDLVDDVEVVEDAEVEEREKGKMMMRRWKKRVRTEDGEVVKAAKHRVDDALRDSIIRVEDRRARMVIHPQTVVVDATIDGRPRNPSKKEQFGLLKDREIHRNRRLNQLSMRVKTKCR